MQSYFGKNTTRVPLLVGKPLNQAVSLLSEHVLVPRIIAETENSNLPVGTVVQQKPDPHTLMRCHQIVMLTVSKLPDPIQAPLVVGKNVEQMMPQLLKMGLQPHVYEFFSEHVVQGVCLAQWPSAGQALKSHDPFIIYCSKNIKKPYIVPDFRGKQLDDVKQLCEKYAIVCQIIASYHKQDDHAYTLVINQRPLPGTFVMLDGAKKLLFQFQV